MRYIEKSIGLPNSLISIGIPFNMLVEDTYFSFFKNYKSLPPNTMLKKILIEEQSGLCAYCQKKLNKTKIEHIICQKDNEPLSSSYHNMIAVCEGKSEGEKHCDTFRGENGNFYGIPLWYFKDCITTGWNSLNPYLDVELMANSSGKIPTGKIIPRHGQNEVLINQVQFLLDFVININTPKLLELRQFAFFNLKMQKIKNNNTWQYEFNDCLQNPKRPFIEFLLLAIRKQVP